MQFNLTKAGIYGGMPSLREEQAVDRRALAEYHEEQAEEVDSNVTSLCNSCAYAFIFRDGEMGLCAFCVAPWFDDKIKTCGVTMCNGYKPGEFMARQIEKALEAERGCGDKLEVKKGEEGGGKPKPFNLMEALEKLEAEDPIETEKAFGDGDNEPADDKPPVANAPTEEEKEEAAKEKEEAKEDDEGDE